MIKRERCERCHRLLSVNVASFSIRYFGEYLCLDCQRKQRNKNYPGLGDVMARYLESKRKKIFKNRVIKGGEKNGRTEKTVER